MNLNPHPTIIPGLRSPYETVGGLVHFGRLLDKIRLHQAGRLPPDWVAAMGSVRGLDGRCSRFLHLDYAALAAEARQGGTDEELLAWAFAHGRHPNEEEIEVFNTFLTKLGWRDAYSERVKLRLADAGLPAGLVETMFDFIEVDEGRAPRSGA